MIKSNWLIEFIKSNFFRGKIESDLLGLMQSPEYWKSGGLGDIHLIKEIETLSKSFYLEPGEEKVFLRRRAGALAISYLDELICDFELQKNRAHKSKLQLLYRMKEWQKLKSEATLCHEKIDKRSADFIFYIACAHWRLGDLKTAEVWFSKINNKTTPSQKRVCDEFNRSNPINAKVKNIDPAQILEHVFIGNFSQYCNLLSEYYESYSLNIPIRFYKSSYEFLRSLLPSLSKEDYLPSGVVDVDCSGMIFTCGFAWSGSGAVSDYLEGFENVSAPVKGELIWTQGRAGMFSLNDVFSSEIFNYKVFFNFILSGVMGLPVYLDLSENGGRSIHMIATGKKEAGGLYIVNNSLLGKSVRNRVDSINFLTDYFDFNKNQSAPALAKNIIKLCRDWSFFMANSKYIIMNNAFMAPRLIGARHFKGAKIVAVIRDPRDQFCARSVESSGNLHGDVDKFIAHLSRSYEKFNSTYLELNGRVLSIKFEDFVRNEEVVKLVQNFCIPNERLSRKADSYQPKMSMPNIGIYKSWDSINDINKIESAFHTGILNFPHQFSSPYF